MTLWDRICGCAAGTGRDGFQVRLLVAGRGGGWGERLLETDITKMGACSSKVTWALGLRHLLQRYELWFLLLLPQSLH
jgi:hypothetical protein